MKFYYLKYRNLTRTVRNFIDWGWNGITVLIYTDITKDPRKLKFNRFSLLFLAVLIILLISITLYNELQKNLLETTLQQNLQQRRDLVKNIYHSLQLKKKYLHQIERKLETIYSLEQLDAFLDNELFQKETTETPKTATKIEEEIQTVLQLQKNIQLLLNRKPGFLLEQLWHKSHIYASIPKGIPMFAGTFKITSGFGYREDPFHDVENNFHSGVDFASAANTPIIAVNRGKVTKVSFIPNNSGYGNYVILHHGLGFMTLYAHCNDIVVKEQEFVEEKQIVAFVGRTGRATGNHLHYEVRIGLENPVDPETFLKIK